MIIPTLNCPGNCKYCWGSDKKAEVMDIQIIKDIKAWLEEFRSDDPVHFTFHGGEPLLAGYEFYKEAFPILNSLKNNSGYSMQSNLWLLNDDMAELLKENEVMLSTSIDGPKDITDYQRGTGYYDKTMKSVKLAEDNGLYVSYVCTFTSYSKDFAEEIYEFFKGMNANVKIHSALPSLRGDNADPWALNQEDYGQVMLKLLDKYLYDLDKIQIMDFDHMAKSTLIRRGTLCAFANCAGDTLAVDYEGNIYPCYRFVGMDEYIMGNVKDKPSFDDLKASSAWAKLDEFNDFVKEDCKKCRFHRYCNGGCPYNAIVANHTPKAVDPQCDAYKLIFKDIYNRQKNDLIKNGIPGMNREEHTRKEGEPYSIMDLMSK
jgi:uncharacterized protein